MSNFGIKSIFMKKVAAYLLLFPLVIHLSLAQEIERAEKTTANIPMDMIQEKIRNQQKTIDSLMILVMAQSNNGTIVEDLDGDTELQEDEILLGKLAMNLDQAIYALERDETGNANKKQKVEKLLDLFAPQFSANLVVLDKEGQAKVARLTRVEFKEEFMNNDFSDNAHHKTTNIDFLDTEIVGDLANITYKSLIQYYEDDTHLTNKTILTTLTCRKLKRLWKIGSFSRTTIEYEVEN